MGNGEEEEWGKEKRRNGERRNRGIGQVERGYGMEVKNGESVKMCLG